MQANDRTWGRTVTPQAQRDTKEFLWTVVPLCALVFYVEWVMATLSTMDPINTLTVVLAALSALLTALGIMVALLAFWGYTSIRDHATNRAEKAAEEAAKTVATSVAKEVASVVASRTVEATLKQDERDTGDYGAAAGGENGGQTAC